MHPEITSARYGADGGWTNCPAQVAGSLRDREAVTANNDLCGDPALGHPKHLEIKYRLDGKERTKRLSENETWNTGTSPTTASSSLLMRGQMPLISPARFGTNAASASATDFAKTKAVCATSWPDFWNSGGAIDLSQSRDPRWMELERRIVLSQYELAAQSAATISSARSA